MKNIYFLLALFLFSGLSYGQDSLKTEIVFVTPGNTPVKVYKLVKERFLYYGDYNYSPSESDTRYYPYRGTSYERKYIATAPASIFVPNNREETFVAVDNTRLVNTRFTTTTDGKRQVWSLVPTGAHYKLGRNTLVIGVAGLIASTFLYLAAAHQRDAYELEMKHYKNQLAMQSQFYNPGQTTLTVDGQTITIPINSGLIQTSFPAPVPPKDNRMGFTIPIVTSSISLAAIVTGFKVMTRNAPRAERIE